MKKLLLPLLMFITTALFADARPMARIPAMPKAPVIDGKINDSEWAYASGQYGTLKYFTDLLTDRQANFYFGWDKKNIYFACRSELPPAGQKLLARVRKNNIMVTADDTIEFLIYPPESKYAYHLIINKLGSYYSAKYEIMDGAVITTPVIFQPKNLKTASSEKNGNWEFELKLPLSEIGVSGNIPANKAWGVQMVRSWQNPADASSWSKTRLFCDINTMGQFYFDNSALPVSFLGLGPDYGDGDYKVRFRVFNTGKTPRNIRCYTLVKSTAVPRMLNTEVKIAPGKYHDFTLSYIEKAPFTFDFTGEITDAASGKMLFQRKFSFNAPKKIRWDSPDQSLNSTSLEIGYYPYSGIVKTRYGSPDVPASKDVTKVDLSLLNSKNELIGSVIDADKCKNGFRKQWTPENLADGEYTIKADIFWKSGKKETLSQRFKVKHFEWEHNNIGKERIIIPPFKPLQVNKDQREIHALLTGYKAAGGFWDAVYAQGENILAAPVTLSVNGNRKFFTEENFSFNETSADKVVTLTKLTGKGLNLQIENDYDYDGMCKATLTFTPDSEGFAAESMVIDIPLKDSVAKLYHCVNDVPRYHPTDYLPAKQGVLWDSRMGKLHPKINGNFWPYVWIGGIYKGFSFFAANDLNWSLDHTKPALEIIRKGDQVALRVHLVNMPIIWKKEFKIVIGFQPSPVKPQPENWQKFYDRGKPAAHAVPITILSPYSYGSGRWWNPFPVGGDYTIVNHLSKVNRRTENKLTTEIIDRFFNKHKGEIDILTKGNSYGGSAVFHEHLHRGRNHQPLCDLMYPYMNPRSADNQWEMYQVYQNEWYFTEYRTNIDYDEYNIEASPSYQDMMLWYARKMLREGMDGIYYDNVRVRATFDPVRGPAYELGDGTVQPFFDFFSFRELLKRTATMIYLEKKFLIDDHPFFLLHMTNGALLPFLSFGTVQVDLESEFGPKEFHDRFSEGYYLAETIGTQAGCIPEILNLVTGNNRKWICRTFVTIQLAFDFPMVVWGKDFDPVVTETWKKVYNFGYASNNCEIIPFWKPGFHPVTCSNPEIRISTYKRTDKNEALIAVCDLGNSAKTVTVDIAGLAYTEPTAVNEETGAVYPVKDNKITVELPRRDFRLIRIKGNLKK